MIDDTLEHLLAMDGTILVIDEKEGLWIKFEIKRVEKKAEIPQGIRYSLTLHDKYNKRIMGFDNAHGIKRKNKSANFTYDHWHRDELDKGRPYNYVNAAKLIEDFWIEVDKKLEMLKEVNDENS